MCACAHVHVLCVWYPCELSIMYISVLLHVDMYLMCVIICVYCMCMMCVYGVGVYGLYMYNVSIYMACDCMICVCYMCKASQW